MKVNEVTSIPQTYLATVRVALRDSSVTARTTITADTVQQAKTILTRIYGDGNVLNINQVMTEEGAKVLSPQEQQVKTMSDQAKRLQQQAKQIKAQNAVKKAQTNLTKAISLKQ